MYECEVVIDQAMKHGKGAYRFCGEHLLLGKIGECVGCMRRGRRLCLHRRTIRRVEFSLETLSVFIWWTPALARSIKGTWDLETLASLAGLLFVALDFPHRA